MSEHLEASRMRWDERQRLMATHGEQARRNVQEVYDEVDQNWTAACEWIAKRMLKYLPDESSVSIVCIARQARSEKSRKSCFRFSDKAHR